MAASKSSSSSAQKCKSSKQINSCDANLKKTKSNATTTATTTYCCRDLNCSLNAQLRTANNNERSSSVASSASSGRSVSVASTITNKSNNTSQTVNYAHNLQDRVALTNINQNKNDIEFDRKFIISLDLDLLTWLLFVLGIFTRFYKLSTPSNVVFDELHYGKYISHYMRNTFFFDQHPPLGKQLIAGLVKSIGYDGNFTFARIGAEYTANVPIFWLRFLPALCGSLLPPAIYKLLLQLQLKRSTALLGGLLVICDNALLTQSRFVLMESMQLLCCTLGLCCLIKFQRMRFATISWFISGAIAAVLFACAISIKYMGLLSYALAVYLMCRFIWQLLQNVNITEKEILWQIMARCVMFSLIPLTLYLGVFYIHLETLHRAGPHDSVMTSAFQASLEGGLASITRGQPLNVVHGSQITLRHTHGRTCWLHSHAHVYPVRYADKRGSSHQQQVTCYSFKDVNNWWIVKRADREDLVVEEQPEPIRHGDIIQLVHGITSRGLNSHDVAAPMTPNCQEVSCYIDYNIKMLGEMLWRVEIINRDTEGQEWHAIKSEVRLIHQSTGSALRYSGRQLPEWGFNQHEIVADRNTNHPDAIWNVEEHRYTKTQDQRERERQLLTAEMIPTAKTKLNFWQKFIELQMKMLRNSKQLQSHMYSSEPFEWPLLDKGIAYWVDSKSNGQIHLLGNVLIWYSGTCSIFIYAAFLLYYLMRRRRLCYDLSETEWQRFIQIGDVCLVGYLMHYLPYFFVDRTLFLHHYLPAFIFKLLLLCYVIEHLQLVFRAYPSIKHIYRSLLLVWLFAVLTVFKRYIPLSYGMQPLTLEELNALRWKDTWDFIIQRDLAVAPLT